MQTIVCSKQEVPLSYLCKLLFVININSPCPICANIVCSKHKLLLSFLCKLEYPVSYLCKLLFALNINPIFLSVQTMVCSKQTETSDSTKAWETALEFVIYTGLPAQGTFSFKNSSMLIPPW